MKLLYICFIGLLSYILCCCSEMNDQHERWMKDGERVYIGKIDSLKVLPGDNKLGLRFWLSDPKAKSVRFHWVPGKDTIRVTVDKTSTDAQEVYIGQMFGNKPIEEGRYTLISITSDDQGNFSVPSEAPVTVYGDRYRSSLTNRVLLDLEFEESEGLLHLHYSGRVNEDETGLKIAYTDVNGVSKTVWVPDSVIDKEDFVEIKHVDPTKEVSYTTLYLPEPLALDTFQTEFTKVVIERFVNVALGKEVTASDQLNDASGPENAVDGMYTGTSRWVSTAGGEHWITVDLGEEYAVSKIRITNGTGGAFNTAIARFSFQIENNGDWEDIVTVTNNTLADYSKELSPAVQTGKIRLYIPNDQARLYELEVYTSIKY